MKYLLHQSAFRNGARISGCRCRFAPHVFFAISLLLWPLVVLTAGNATVSQSDQSDQDWAVIDQTIRESLASPPQQKTSNTGDDGMLRLDVPIFAAFDINSASIKSSFLPILEQVAITLTKNPEVVMEVVGRNSSSESGADDRTLALNRARNIGTFFEHRGVAPKRISVIGIKPSATGKVVKDKSTETGDEEGKFGILLFVQASSR